MDPNPEASVTSPAPDKETPQVPQKRSFLSRFNLLGGILDRLKRNKTAAQKKAEESILMPGPAPTLPPEQSIVPSTSVQPSAETEEKKAA